MMPVLIRPAVSADRDAFLILWDDFVGTDPDEPGNRTMGPANWSRIECGALHALPTLACYAALWTLLREGGIDGHVVVKKSSAQYRQPVNQTFRASCQRPPADVAAEFISDLRRHKKARMDLESVVLGANGKPAVEFTGSFVAVV